MVLRSKKRMLFLVVICVAIVTMLLNVLVFQVPFYRDLLFYVVVAIFVIEVRNMFNAYIDKDDPHLILIKKQYDLNHNVIAFSPASYLEGWNRFNGLLILGSDELYFEAHPESAFNYKIRIPTYDIETVEYNRFIGIINGIKVSMKNGDKHNIRMYDADKFLPFLRQEISLEQGIA